MPVITVTLIERYDATTRQRPASGSLLRIDFFSGAVRLIPGFTDRKPSADPTCPPNHQ